MYMSEMSVDVEIVLHLNVMSNLLILVSHHQHSLLLHYHYQSLSDMLNAFWYVHWVWMQSYWHVCPTFGTSFPPLWSVSVSSSPYHSISALVNIFGTVSRSEYLRDVNDEMIAVILMPHSLLIYLFFSHQILLMNVLIWNRGGYSTL